MRKAGSQIPFKFYCLRSSESLPKYLLSSPLPRRRLLLRSVAGLHRLEWRSPFRVHVAGASGQEERYCEVLVESFVDGADDFEGVDFGLLANSAHTDQYQQYSLVPMKRASESPLNRFNRSINLPASPSPLPARCDLSPKRVRAHTVYNEEKLKVFIKFKPTCRGEGEEQVRFVSEHEVEVRTALKNKMYQFDHVFNAQQTHLQVFDVGCRDIIDHVFTDHSAANENNNGLIFVYGNTGTGKTYSMGLLGMMAADSEGIVPNSLRYIFHLKRRKCYEHYNISISFSEVYMDEVYDLLDFENEAKLAIREDSKTKQPFLENETTIAISNVEQAFQIINIGLEKRRVAEQKMNRKSSRGHGLITVHLTSNCGDKTSKMCFIDLAGCERLKDSQSKGVTLSEALHINSSLSALETLLMNISDQNVRNYRGSKLTRILQPYIEFGRINLFVTSTADSLNAVEFAKRCKGIRFMERELRASTPIKRSNITEKGRREVEELQQQRREAIEREKRLVGCILSLTNLISRISECLEQTLRGQTLHSKFSFSDILNNADLEGKINAKIQEYEQKEERLIEHNLHRLETALFPQSSAEDVAGILEFPQQLTSQLTDHTHQLLGTLKAFGVYAEYKNLYKKEFFTSELKLSLLEGKCKGYEQTIRALLKFVNTDDKRVARKLRDIGIVIGKENIENVPHVRNRQSHSKTIEKAKSGVRETPVKDEATSNNHSDRSAIYIDEV